MHLLFTFLIFIIDLDVGLVAYGILDFPAIHIIEVGLGGVEVDRVELSTVTLDLGDDLLLLLLICGTVCWVIVVHSQSVLHALTLVLFLVRDVRQNVFYELVGLENAVVLGVVVTSRPVLTNLLLFELVVPVESLLHE